MFCQCGCEQITNIFRGQHRKFISGHNGKGFRHSEETKKKMSENSYKNGFAGFWKNKKRSDENRLKLKIANTGKKLSSETKNKISNIVKLAMQNPERRLLQSNIGKQRYIDNPSLKDKMRLVNTGKKLSKETIEKIIKKRKENNYFHTEETKQKIRKSNIGKKRTEETKLKMSVSFKGKKKSKESILKRIGKYTGEKSHFWKGGISKLHKKYNGQFTNQLKEKIRNRDNNICQICNKTEFENCKKLDVHHIDANKRHNDEYNLISLCIKCHAKIGHINTIYWKYFLINKIIQIYKEVKSA